jgi:hypothetical protein
MTLRPGQFGAVGLGERPLVTEHLGRVSRDSLQHLRGQSLELGHVGRPALQRNLGQPDVLWVHAVGPVEVGYVIRRRGHRASGARHLIR